MLNTFTVKESDYMLEEEVLFLVWFYNVNDGFVVLDFNLAEFYFVKQSVAFVNSYCFFYLKNLSSVNNWKN